MRFILTLNDRMYDYCTMHDDICWIAGYGYVNDGCMSYVCSHAWSAEQGRGPDSAVSAE